MRLNRDLRVSRRTLAFVADCAVAVGLCWLLSALVLGLTPTGPTIGELESERLSEQLEVGRKVVASPDSLVHWAMVYGFAEPEPDGTWITSIEARLELNAAPDVEKLRVNLYPFISKGELNRSIRVKTAEGVSHYQLFDGITSIEVAVVHSNPEEIIIECDSTRSPFLLGEGPDQRRLCVKLLSVEALGDIVDGSVG